MSEALTSNRPVVLHARVVTGTGGGPDKTILNSPRFLRDLGYDSVCACLHPPNDPEKPTIVAVGRLSKEKAFDILIRAFDDLLETGLDATLVIAGDGPERDALHQLIKSLGREGSVQLTGQVADPRTVYAAADVFALSSLSEGLPNSLLEAMACGVPVVATTVGAVPNVVTDDINGLLVEPGETAPLALALARLLSNSALQDQLATNGRSTIEQRFSFAGRMQKIAAIYGSVLPRQDFANGQVKSGTPAAEWRQHIASGASPRIDVLTKPESREAAKRRQRSALMINVSQASMLPLPESHCKHKRTPPHRSTL